MEGGLCDSYSKKELFGSVSVTGKNHDLIPISLFSMHYSQLHITNRFLTIVLFALYFLYYLYMGGCLTLPFKLVQIYCDNLGCYKYSQSWDHSKDR